MNIPNLNGKVAVVTGGSGVLCSEFCKVLAKAGCKVAIVGISVELGDALEKEIKVFAFDNGVILGKKQKKNFSKEASGRIPVAQKNVEVKRESAWDILDKYVPNK